LYSYHGGKLFTILEELLIVLLLRDEILLGRDS